MSLETILKKTRKFFGGVALCAALTGCSSSQKFEADVAKYALPANVAIAYFGAIGTHEAGHAITAQSMGADKIRVSVFPGTTEKGSFLGYTTYYRNSEKFSSKEDTILGVAGPSVSFVSGMWPRELLKTEEVPELLQPTLQWYALGNKAMSYSNIINGLIRQKGSDLGDEHVGISIGFLAVSLAYDIYDILSDDPARYFGVLIGEKFYKKEKQVELVSEFDNEFMYFGIRIKW